MWAVVFSHKKSKTSTNRYNDEKDLQNEGFYYSQKVSMAVNNTLLSANTTTEDLFKRQSLQIADPVSYYNNSLSSVDNASVLSDGKFIFLKFFD